MPNAQGQIIIADFEGEVPWDVLDAAGYDGACFYVAHYTRKCPSQAWIDEGLRRGRILLPVGEDGGRGSAGGAPAGTAFAQFMNTRLAQIGWSKDRPIANAESDYPASTSDPMVLAYYRAFFETIGWKLVVTYADGEVCRAVKANGWSVGSWFTCSSSFPGSSDPTGMDLKQRCTGEDGLVTVPGYSVDTDIVLNPALFDPQGELTMAQLDDLNAKIDKVAADVAAIRAGVVLDIAEGANDANEAPGLPIAERLLHVHAIVRDAAIAAGRTPAEWDAQLAQLRGAKKH